MAMQWCLYERMTIINCPECGRQVSGKAPTCPHCGAPIASPASRPFLPAVQAPAKKNVSCLTAGCVIFGVLVIIGMIAGGSGNSGGSSSPSSPAASPPPPSREETALNNTKLVDFSWSKGGFDNVMLATFVIKNNNDFPIKDITVKCTHSAKSGTEIDSNTHTIYDTIKPHKKRTFREVNMGFIHSQAASSGCTVTGVVPE
jgi:hypothetical protein